MAKIRPFKGIIYNSEIYKDDLSNVIAPPYDVIDAKHRNRLLDKHPDNLLSQFTYAFYLFMRANIQGAPKEDYQDPLDRMLAILEKFKISFI